jgi:Leucine Rich repeat
VRTRTAAAGLAVIATLRNLEELNLDYTTVDAKSFAAFQGMPKLRELHLDSADVGDESVDVLASMPSLQSVNLYHTTVTETGAKKLREALPKCQVIWDRDSARPNRRKT